MKKLNPCNDRVVVKPIEEDEQLYGNIIVPEMGEVIATGPGRMSEFGKHIPVKVKVGSVVLVPKIGSIRVELDGEEYYIVQDREVLATIEEDIEEDEV